MPAEVSAAQCIRAPLSDEHTIDSVGDCSDVADPVASRRAGPPSAWIATGVSVNSKRASVERIIGRYVGTSGANRSRRLPSPEVVDGKRLAVASAFPRLRHIGGSPEIARATASI
jgi:hypothetical protein